MSSDFSPEKGQDEDVFINPLTNKGVSREGFHEGLIALAALTALVCSEFLKTLEGLDQKPQQNGVITTPLDSSIR